MSKSIYIAGEWLEEKKKVSVYSPYNQEKINEILVASRETVERAIQTAVNAKETMKSLTGLEKYTILMEIAEQFEIRRNEAAEIIAKESGKPLKFSLAEIDRTIETYKFAAEEAKRIVGEMIPMDAAKNGRGRFAYTIHEPIGIVAAITPFNFPQNLVAHKVAPSIAAGNPIILKPATQTAFSAIFLAEIISKTSLPVGGFNLITGEGKDVGDILCASDDIAMITFTGSTSVGKHILSTAGLKKVSLELGSNAGAIISNSEDLENIAKKCAVAAFSNQGQVCISLQRIYVLEEKYSQFIEYLKYETEKLVLGDPLDINTDVSSMINPKEQDRAIEWIEESVQEGANLITGGKVKNNVVMPTILSDVEDISKVSCKEVFAPIVIVNKIKNLDDGIKKINNSIYGLQAAIFTDHIAEAFKAQKELAVGGVVINDIPTYRVDQMPYGGVKESGNTKEGLKYSIEEMTIQKLVVWNNEKF